MSRADSPPIEQVIDTFHKELDNLTKSFDDMLSHQENESKKFSATTPQYQPKYASYSSTKRTPSRVYKDPPPSAERFSPLRNFANTSTPARRTPAPAYAYSPAQPPPAPVETPAYLRRPSATTNRYGGRDTHERSSSVDEPNNYSFTLAPGGWEDALDKMRKTLNEQERAIIELKRENEMLRRKLKENEDFSTYRDEPVSPPRHYSNGSQRFSGGETYGRPPASTSATYRPNPMSTPVQTERSPPRRVYMGGISERIPEEGFTPGTRFVAELTQLMQMETGHHVPLSIIVDKHWDKLKHYFRTDDV